jgi:hypothetical protein
VFTDLVNKGRNISVGEKGSRNEAGGTEKLTKN